MQELRLVLIIVGALAIAALLLHGLWSSRKEKPAKFGEKPLGKLDESSSVDVDGFDQDGVGSVRVVNGDDPTPEKARPSRKEPELHFGEKIQADPLLDSAESGFSAEPELDLPKMSAKPDVQPAIVPEAEKDKPASQAVTPEPAQPVMASEPIIAEVEVQEPQAQQPEAQQSQPTESKLVSAETELPAPALKVTEEMIVVEPSEQPFHVEAEKPQAKIEPVIEKQTIVEPEPEPEPELNPGYLVLNVHARNGEKLRGTKLFNSLEQNNLFFGENSVYHRHADFAGTGPVIFSVTNMVHPAHFPEGGGDGFETPGIAFYLMLPCHGLADQNFNQMLQTVQRVADELGADVLDHERAMITPHRIDEYREKAKLYTRA